MEKIDDSQSGDSCELSQLKLENQKLRKINSVLVSRVETRNDQVASSYSAFEHSVSLVNLVNERTEALNNALAETKVAHEMLLAANAETAKVSQFLEDAIESISDAFVLFDPRRRIVRFNSKFAKIWSDSGVDIREGITLSELDTLASSLDLIPRAYPRTDSNARVYLLADGRWIQMNERVTSDGGLVVLYTDISDLMASESERRELVLAQQAESMRRTIDNLSQGIILVNRGGLPSLWNQQFLNLTSLSEIELLSGKPFPVLIRSSQALEEHNRLTRMTRSGVTESTYHTAQEQVLEIKTHPLPDGSSVYTFTDITERYVYEESLKQSEQWIRLIADNVPAMIAFVGPDKRFRFVNRGYADWLNREPDELLNQSINDVSDLVLSDYSAVMIERALAGENLTFESWEKNASGESRYILKAYVTNIDLHGNPDGFFIMNRDITERHQHSAQLEARVAERTFELTQLNYQLDEARKDAEKANLSKTKFLAAVSHDLLQPLNAARLFTASLEQKADTESIRTLSNCISVSLDDVESLLRTLVDISKLDAGVVHPEPTHFPVKTLLDTLAIEFRELAGSHSLEFEYRLAGSFIETDSQLLARILRNLLTNAIRYTQKGKITLRARERSNRLDIQVWDTGIGIAKHDLNTIFHEFKRIEGVRDRAERGLGLGLAIVEKLSRVLDHPIKVHSRLGRGSMFSVSVPTVKPHVLSETVSKDTHTAFADRLEGATIWLIDNDTAICRAMETLLMGWGCKIVWAVSLEELKNKVDIGSDGVDLLIVDYHLDNDELGTDAAAQIVKSRGKELKVLMITANYTKDVNREIRDLGYYFMNKPVKPLKLRSLASHLIANA